MDAHALLLFLIYPVPLPITFSCPLARIKPWLNRPIDQVLGRQDLDCPGHPSGGWFLGIEYMISLVDEL
jgi:hypothetical protein